MRKIIFAVFVLILFALNWAALHDIIKGEQNPWMEWSFVIGSALLLIVHWIRQARHSA